MSSAGTASKRRGWMPLPLAIVAASLAALIAVPASGTGAYWTATATGAAGDVGTGQWCAAPDPAASGARFIRLSSVTTATTTNRQVAIIPVANNASWGGSAGAKNLSVRLWGCQTSPVADTLRITSWSNPLTPAARTWTVGSDTVVAPTSRLSATSTLGAQLVTLAQSATVPITRALFGQGDGDGRRFSWIVSSGRTSSTPTPSSDPATCYFLLGTLASCNLPLTNATAGDNTFAQTFNTSPWTTPTIAAVTYPARTYALQTTGGWATKDASPNGTCDILGCTTAAGNTFLNTATAPSTSWYNTIDGNQLQWLVIQWTGTVTPTDDLVVEVVLS